VTSALPNGACTMAGLADAVERGIDKSSRLDSNARVCI
jgi:hypothetical protein